CSCSSLKETIPQIIIFLVMVLIIRNISTLNRNNSFYIYNGRCNLLGNTLKQKSGIQGLQILITVGGLFALLYFGIPYFGIIINLCFLLIDRKDDSNQDAYKY